MAARWAHEKVVLLVHPSVVWKVELWVVLMVDDLVAQKEFPMVVQ